MELSCQYCGKNFKSSNRKRRFCSREHYMSYIAENGNLNKNVNPGFKKGHTPWNKGKKTGLNSDSEFLFKKGHTPWNKGKKLSYEPAIKAKTFEVRLRKRKHQKYPRKYIKIETGEWVLYSKYLWETNFGEIPKGYTVGFKDNDTFNHSFENLELITIQEFALRQRRINNSKPEEDGFYGKKIQLEIKEENDIEKLLKRL